jgi:hypothetical protein
MAEIPGVLLSITTRSGGSQFTATAYEFLRNNAIDAAASRFVHDGKTLEASL